MGRMPLNRNTAIDWMVARFIERLAPLFLSTDSMVFKMTTQIQSPALGEQPNIALQQRIDLAQAWAAALGGGVFNWRFIHDRDKATPAIKRRGTLDQVWPEACQWNNAGYGIFATVNVMDGTGYMPNGQPIPGAHGDTLEHVVAIRAQVADLDDLNAMQNLERAAAHDPAPWFAVQTSPGKAHVYWPVLLGTVDAFKPLQRKIVPWFGSDKAVIDATRVLRVPGFYHLKGEPHLVTCWQLPGYGKPILQADLATSLAHVTAIDHDGGTRHPLGDPVLAGPSREWVRYAIETMPIDGMDHASFISFLTAFKQAGWTLFDADELREMFLQWCKRFGADSKGDDYNLKHWDSITETELGWKSLLRQNPNLNGAFLFHGAQHVPVAPVRAIQDVGPIPTTEHQPTSELMLAEDCKQYFAGCTFVTRFGEILDPLGQLLGPTQFNGKYGGPRFVIAPNNTAPTDEPWKAATRSFFWRIPTVDYLRFLPHEKPGAIITDELGRTGVNVFKPANIRRVAGDPAPFLHHLSLILPVPSDQKILLDFIAHNAKYPGHKIPWAPLLQSTEGAGKGIFKSLFRYIVGSAYFHSPQAKELIEGGSKFNAWMRRKLFILVDEIKTDERRDMIEVLKPWISEAEIEIQGKGQDQDKEDNYANWAFFSNYKDAVPINQNSRRFAIFYSAIQSENDLLEREMDETYFTWLNNWFDHKDGGAILANYFANEYQLERGSIPMRAPKTSSHREAIRQGRTPIERAILDAVEIGVPGFKGGFIGTYAASEYLRHNNIRLASAGGLERIIESLGYHMLGRMENGYFQEDQGRARTVLFHLDKNADPALYPHAQGYGNY